MRTAYEERAAEQTEIQRQIRQGTGKIVSRKFGTVAKLLWPIKTAEHIAAIASADTRTAGRWLSGEYDPPLSVVLAVVNEIFGDTK